MDEEALQFHIQRNDCFGTLATVVDQVRQSMEKHGTSIDISALGQVRDELMYLQRYYTLSRDIQ